MNTNTIIPIFFACDNKYVKYTMVAMKSIIENASADYIYHMHILHTDVSAAMQDKVRELETNCVKVYFDDVTEKLKKLDGELPVRDYYSHTTYYRLFIADMYPQYDKDLNILFLAGKLSKYFRIPYSIQPEYLILADNIQVILILCHNKSISIKQLYKLLQDILFTERAGIH